MADKLNPKQTLFCLEYIKDFNGSAAAIRAGYSEKTSYAIASENLKKPHIQEEIAKLIHDRNETVKVDATYVLNRLHEIDQLDVLDILNDDMTFKKLSEWPKAWRISLSAIDIAETQSDQDYTITVKKIKWPDKTRNLELLGKHVDVSAFQKDKDEDSAPATPVTINFNTVTKDAD